MTPLETRLLAALSAIHDHLHQGRINEAHQACECALEGTDVSQPNLALTDAANAQAFIASFNKLAQQHRLLACAVMYLPSATRRNYVSVQIGGNVHACKLLEEQLGSRPSTYMGEHGG